MSRNPDNSPEKRAAYALRLKGLSNQQLFDECKDKIWFSAYADNNPRSCFHWQADACYSECSRRGQPEIYNNAYRVMFLSCTGSDPHPEEGPIQEKWGDAITAMERRAETVEGLESA